MLLAEVVEEDARLFSVELVVSRQLDAKTLFKTLHHWNTTEWWREIDLNHVVFVLWTVRMILNLVCSMN